MQKLNGNTYFKQAFLRFNYFLNLFVFDQSIFSHNLFDTP